MLDGAPLGIAVDITAYLFVKEFGVGDLARGEEELLHDRFEVDVHFVANFRFAVANVVLVGALPFDCIGSIASHDGILHGDGREKVVDDFSGTFGWEFEGLFDRAVVQLLNGSELGRVCVHLSILVLLVID